LISREVAPVRLPVGNRYHAPPVVATITLVRTGSKYPLPPAKGSRGERGPAICET